MRSVLDDIADQRCNPRAFGEWQGYRQQLTDLVMAAAPKGSTLAIYGAGRCNDIDLGRLSDHFRQITLLDCDAVSMEQALQAYGLSEDPAVKRTRFDFVGIAEGEYRELEHAMRRALDAGSDTDAGELVSRIRPALEVFYEACRDPLYRAPRYDAVLAAGLHSQLNQTPVSMWRTLCQERGRRTDPLRDPVCAQMHERTAAIIARFDQLLFYSARQKAFVAYEKGIVGRTGGVQGAMQLQDDLQRRMQQGQIRLLREHVAFWPQNGAKGMVFEMAIDEFDVLK